MPGHVRRFAAFVQPGEIRGQATTPASCHILGIAEDLPVIRPRHAGSSPEVQNTRQACRAPRGWHQPSSDMTA